MQNEEWQSSLPNLVFFLQHKFLSIFFNGKLILCTYYDLLYDLDLYCIDVRVAQTVVHEPCFQGSAHVGVLWRPLQDAPLMLCCSGSICSVCRTSKPCLHFPSPHWWKLVLEWGSKKAKKQWRRVRTPRSWALQVASNHNHTSGFQRNWEGNLSQTEHFRLLSASKSSSLWKEREPIFLQEGGHSGTHTPPPYPNTLRHTCTHACTHTVTIAILCPELGEQKVEF